MRHAPLSWILLAALQPPSPHQLVAALDETSFRRRILRTCHTQMASGAIAPQGLQYIEASSRWNNSNLIYADRDARLEKRIWMRQDENPLTFVTHCLMPFRQLSFTRKCSSIIAIFMALLSGRLAHARRSLNRGIGVLAYDVQLHLSLSEDAAAIRKRLVSRCFFRRSVDRGLDDHEDHLFAACFTPESTPQIYHSSSRRRSHSSRRNSASPSRSLAIPVFCKLLPDASRPEQTLILLAQQLPLSAVNSS